MAISKIILNGVTQMDLTQDTVAASNLLQSYTAHGADGQAITGAATAGSTPSLQTKTKTYTPTTSQQTESISADSGYDGLSAVNVTVNAIPTGELVAAETYSIANPTISVGNDGSIAVTGESHQIVNPVYTSGYIDTSATQYVTATVYGTYQQPIGIVTAPSSISGTAASVSTGTNTLTLTKTVSVTPNVTTAGYISSGTATNSSVSLTASVTTKAAATITPTTTNQTIASGTYLTGTQTIVGDADLIGSNILSTANIFGVQGTVDFVDVYIRSAAPTSSVGNDGDIYIQE